MEDGSAAVTRLLGVKSLDAVIQVQTDYAKTSCANMMAQAAKVGEMLTSVGQDAFKPFESTIGVFTALRQADPKAPNSGSRAASARDRDVLGRHSRL